MSRENVELARSIYAAWERGDFGSADWAHPNIEYLIADGPAPGRWKGLAGMANGVREWLSAWEDFRFEGREYREIDDDGVLVLTAFTGHGKTSGVEVGQVPSMGAGLFRIRDGKVLKLVMYLNSDGAFDDLDLPANDPSE